MLLTTRTRAYPFSKDVWGLYGICKRKAVINVAKIKKEIIVEDVLVFLVRTSWMTLLYLKKKTRRI